MPAFHRELDELARRIGSRPRPPRARERLRAGLSEAGRVVVALILSVPLVFVLVKLVLSGHAYFAALGFSTRSASRLGGLCALALIFALLEIVRWLWPRLVAWSRDVDPSPDAF